MNSPVKPVRKKVDTRKNHSTQHFRLLCAVLVLTKLGDLLASPKIVLTWLLGAVGVSPVLISLLVPIRESGSMIPQIAIGTWVNRFVYRKGLWQLGAFIQGLTVLGMAAALWLLSGDTAGYTVLALLVLFSLARALCSVTIKDMQGKVIAKKQRGRLSGFAASIAGVLTFAVSLVFFIDASSVSTTMYLALLLLAGLLWWLAGMLFWAVQEPPGENRQPGDNQSSALSHAWQLICRDRKFRHFLLSRALLMGSALSAPFMLLLAQAKQTQSSTFALFLLASSLAAGISASVWGLMADQSSRRVMLLGGVFAALSCLAVWGTELQSNDAPVWLYALFYLSLSVAHEGVRIGRQTYLVNMAGGIKRTDYVSVSNTVIGSILLLMGGITALLASFSVSAVIFFLGLMGLAGSWSTWRMAETD
ncbi:MFS transporter [Bowmanella pacifica]|nr:MFS transporter [Bowmanella pacifica]